MYQKVTICTFVVFREIIQSIATLRKNRSPLIIKELRFWWSRGEYSTEALIRDKEAFRRKYPRLTVDPVTLDEIMVFLERGTRS